MTLTPIGLSSPTTNKSKVLFRRTFQENCVIVTAKKIIDALREAEKHLLAAMKTEDQTKRIDLEKRAQLCLTKAKRLERQLDS
jgi:UDP-N-acetylglucosamine 2-epimerase